MTGVDACPGATARAAAGAAMSCLAHAGFVPAGPWNGDSGFITFRLYEQHAHVTPALYALAVNGSLVYIGKTAASLTQRLADYRSPARDPRSGASTNRMNHDRIAAALACGFRVEIWVFVPDAELRHGDFRPDLPAALERAMIERFAPHGTPHIAVRRSQQHPTIPPQPARAPPARAPFKMEFT